MLKNGTILLKKNKKIIKIKKSSSLFQFFDIEGAFFKLPNLI